MFKRVAMWKLKGSVQKAQILEMKRMLESLAINVGSTNSVEVGINASNSKSAYDIVFTVTFDGIVQLQEFESDPYHKKVGEFVSELKESRVVVDYEL